jgi:hypothetical protein
MVNDALLVQEKETEYQFCSEQADRTKSRWNGLIGR